MSREILPCNQIVPARPTWLGAFVVLVLLVGSLSLVACRMPEPATAEPPPEPTAIPEPEVQVEPEPTAPQEPQAAEVPAEQPAAEEQPTTETTTEVVAPEEIDWTQHVTVSENYYIRGNPDAPVLIVDVSDFL